MKHIQQPSSRSTNALQIPWILLCVLGLILSACSGGGQNQTPSPDITQTLSPEATSRPTITPTPEPLGSTANPFILGTVGADLEDQTAAAAQELARQLGESAGVVMEAHLFKDYTALLEAMEEGEVHITWLPPLTYLYASQRGLAEVVLLTNHFGVYQYGAQFMANVESGFTPYYDPISGRNSADAAEALAQFDNLRPCWVEPLSPAGYIVPAGLLAINQINSLPPVMTQSHTATVRALYIKGICDFGATFSVSGDPRTSSAVLDDLPDTMNRVLIIWRSDGVIPNLNVSFLAGLSERDRLTLTNAFLNIVKTPEGKALLTLAAGNYQIDDLREVEDSLYDPLRAMVDALDINTVDLIGR